MSAMVVTVSGLRLGKVSWPADGKPVEACSIPCLADRDSRAAVDWTDLDLVRLHFPGVLQGSVHLVDEAVPEVSLRSSIAICYILSMHVISQKRIREAAARFPWHERALSSWYRLMKTTTFENFAALRRAFPGVDKVGRYFVFNVAGNHLRIIAAVHFNRRKIYIREVLTHTEYDDEKWKR